MIHPPEPDQEAADIVDIILTMVVALTPGFSAAIAKQIEQQVRAEYGGLRFRVPKRGKYLTANQREAVFKDGLTAMPTGEVTEKHRIGRATLYRIMKGGGGRFGGA